MSSQDLEDLKKFETPKGVLKGFLCPVCWTLFEAEDLAVLCMESHDELLPELIFQTGDRFPIEVIVKRLKGEEITEVASYERKKIEKVSIKLRRKEG